MGYVREPETTTLEFADGKLSGLEVTLKEISIGEYLRVLRLMELREESPESVEELLHAFTDNLAGWNLEEPRPELEGCPLLPVPITYESVKAQGLKWILKVIVHWLRSVTGVQESSPLAPTSDGGPPSVEESIPMDAPSPSQLNSATPN